MRLLHPWALALCVPALAAAAAALLRPRGARLGLPAGAIVRARRPTLRARASRVVPPALQAAALCLIALALARPQKTVVMAGGDGEGIDIALSIDSSLSMQAVDFKPTRLDAAKATARRFVLGRAQDRISLTTFGGAPLLLCPPTIDYDALLGRLDDLSSDMTRAEGTAVGDGLAAAVARLKDSSAKSKVAILLTDGRSNTGVIDPLTAAKAAASFGIKVYAIGVASKGDSTMTIDDPRYGRVTVPVTDDLDEELLAEIARLTGGKAYRAQDGAELKGVFAEIDRLEKSKVALPRITAVGDLHVWPLALALALLLLEGALTAGPLLRWP
ncbi:MAG: VWA domain-containing protein [Elusimicrobiota bacterium]|nr:MAG: VWA domain-containing protein [Elusimicrobiota bacterium]